MVWFICSQVLVTLHLLQRSLALWKCWSLAVEVQVVATWVLVVVPAEWRLAELIQYRLDRVYQSQWLVLQVHLLHTRTLLQMEATVCLDRSLPLAEVVADLGTDMLADQVDQAAVDAPHQMVQDRTVTLAPTTVVTKI
jgi:hypothetical protein